MSHIVECPPLEDALFNRDVVQRTVKFLNTSFHGTVQVNDVVDILKSVDIPASDVETIARGISDKEVSVVFSSTQPLGKLLQKETYKVMSKTIRVVCSGRQIISVRVHWLPVYLSNTVVEALLKPYGKILDVHSGSTSVANRSFKSGVRVVRMEVDEVDKNKIPHMFKFQCGNKALVTIQGRPPLCLKCLQIGHFRNNCTGEVSISSVYFKIQKSFSDAKKTQCVTAPEEEVTASTSEAPVTQPEVEKGVEDEEMSEVNTECEVENPQSHLSEEDGRGTKRSQDVEDTEVNDSFHKNFPPLKSRKPSHVPAGIEVSNPFSVLDLVSDSPLVIDDSRFDTEVPAGTGDDLLEYNS